ncbi:MAG: hypothetical protein O3A59_14000 [Nitrospirae bacterium]|nr:hypothetical protein [Nitrospirota bacterium]
MLQNRRPTAVRGNVQKSSSSPVLSGVEGKAAAILTRGAYSQYVSANAAKSGKSVSPKVRQKGDYVCASRFGKARERRWRLFSTFPVGEQSLPSSEGDEEGGPQMVESGSSTLMHLL